MPTNTPTVSVIIPTYKRPAKLLRALRSVLEQDFGDFEVLVVDDNPPDSDERRLTIAALDGADPRVRHLETPGSLGGAAARNVGIQAARGDFVAFLDDDDEWLPGKLRKQMALFYMVPDHVGSIDTGFMEIDERKGTTREVKPGLKGWIFEDLLVKSRGRAPKLSSMVVRTAVLREAGGFDSELPSRQDLDLYLRMARICSFENIEEPLVCKYIHLGERITSSTSKKLEGFDRLYVKYQSDLLQRPEIHRVYLKRHAYWMLRGGHPVSAVCKYLQGMMVR